MSVEENINRMALQEARKTLRNVTSEGTIEITILKNVPLLTKSTENRNSQARQAAVVQFIKEACGLLESTIDQLVLSIGLGDGSPDMGILSFSDSEMSSNILIPDYYAMIDYSGMLKIPDGLDFSRKINKAFFIGSSTGSEDANYNDRLKLCAAYANHQSVKCYIHNICHKVEHLKSVYPNYTDWINTSNGRSIPYQRKYKYLINVDGNTCAWDRIPWILNSNSILLKKKSSSSSKCWYYDLLENGVHYIEFDKDTEITTIMEKMSTADCQRIIAAANQFCRDYLTRKSHLTYMAKLLHYLTI